MNAAVNNPVGRPRQFDEAEVLQGAMDVFWRKGYEGTSMSDLMAATGLHKGSLYQAFGNKHQLYIRALQDYIANMAAKMGGIVNGAESGVEGIRAAMYHHIDMGACEDGVNSGCMALNSLVEDAQHDEDIMAVLGTAYEMRMRLIGEAVARAQGEGDLRGDIPVERLANIIASLEAGLLAELKGPLDEAGARSQVDDLLTALG